MEEDKKPESEEVTEETEEEVSTESEEEEEQEEEPVIDDEEPPVRKSAKDYIIERKNKKIEKLQEGQEEGEPDVRAIIREELDPIKQTFAKSKDEEELQSALQKYPEAKKLEKTVRRYMDSEAYSQVPAEFIVRALLGAKETAKAKADDEAKATRQGGHSKRPKEVKEKSAWDLSEEEFKKEVSKVMSSQNN